MSAPSDRHVLLDALLHAAWPVDAGRLERVAADAAAGALRSDPFVRRFDRSIVAATRRSVPVGRSGGIGTGAAHAAARGIESAQ